MLRGLIGDTGGGKTMTLVKKLIETLLNTERFCVTNLQELNLARLNEYLQEEQARLAKKYPHRRYKPVLLDDRLLVIPKQDTRWFYRFRPEGLVLPQFSELGKDGKKIPLDEFNAKIEPYFEPATQKRGVEYFMSECHRFFPAREFVNFARTMNFYSTQHRHLDDNVWLETQFPMQIDSNLRELVVEWYHIRNQYRESFGMFRKPGRFCWRMFYDLPKGSKDVPDDKGEFKLDVAGVASCYKTRGAVNSALADTPEEQPKSKKLPFWALPAAVVVGIMLAGCVVAMIPKVAQKGVAALLGGAAKGAAEVVPAAAEKSPTRQIVDTPKPDKISEVSENPPMRIVRSQPSPDRSQVRVRGYAVRGGRVNVSLSNGLTLTERDVAPSFVTVGGQVLFLAEPRESGAARAAFTAPEAAIPAQESPSLPPPPAAPESAWETHSDGVSRLKKPDSLATMFGR